MKQLDGQRLPKIIDPGILEKFRRHGVGSAQRMRVQRGYIPNGSWRMVWRERRAGL